ncbi:hypothetical protein B0T19DRAFT_424976 [Cercophora scortea]|uniref:Uncharacterized protein n=1 Tax=Cercophora scortea TaxID=314031 RepID=A0AAE0MEB2_9PEZI|nr:hypothetical protein B0T19DRAFT_424976 [Cercophora scortea]
MISIYLALAAVLASLFSSLTKSSNSAHPPNHFAVSYTVNPSRLYDQLPSITRSTETEKVVAGLSLIQNCFSVFIGSLWLITGLFWPWSERL